MVNTFPVETKVVMNERKAARKAHGRWGDEKEKELTGFDAEPGEADFGSAGNGASLDGADLAGGVRELEEEPGTDDILPDQLGYFAEPPREEPLTAQPNERPRREEPGPSNEHHEDERPSLSTVQSQLPKGFPNL